MHFHAPTDGDFLSSYASLMFEDVRSASEQHVTWQVSALVELPSHETAYSMFDEGAPEHMKDE